MLEHCNTVDSLGLVDWRFQVKRTKQMRYNACTGLILQDNDENNNLYMNSCECR